MARQPLAIGTYGKISCKQQPNGSYRASTRYRDDDGETRTVQAFGPTKGKAEFNLKEKLKKRDHGKGKTITPDTKLSELADLWLADLEYENRTSETSIDHYREEIDVSTDKRARKGTIKIKSALGGVRVREATTSRLDRHLKKVAQVGAEKARIHRVILSGMMGLAVRHDAIDQNPVRDVSRIHRTKQKPRTADLETLERLRAQLKTWQSGKAIPGTAAYTHGPKRSQTILDIAEVLMGTGVRFGEVLAIRWCDLDLAAEVPRLTVCGTITRRKGQPKGEGLIRQEWTKTEAGYRSITLPPFAVDTLMRRKLDAVPNKLDLVFPTRTGGIYDPNNFRRTWREARGTEFAWVTPVTFRKTVATLIANDHDDKGAASQLGHSDDGATARKYYIEKPHEAGDFRSSLNLSRG
ncbi:tyrosine-type recombinase/integrase [Nocardia terpenica]|uniref:tyrosine-type recombinase/integrase n=1 Tax=Nocardia terpenica TaxID=455432 RepID=UPI00189617F0|nr:tyrosine-type recombinase/integrase [Nocardia terpenica]MBF6065031.1 tyrosine-type recombinase/integrase [Nocardia terpenica]MBF6108088.1 tyrosine-type recombinase/integrase [Nocardia terpenica]MBF6115303.1 tyrosine-type recombinase/integrase [Nocardia terpenica]MBF6122625.1 tyrosine-type recombinase/integrase [Nocardia terpenica]